LRVFHNPILADAKIQRPVAYQWAHPGLRKRSGCITMSAGTQISPIDIYGIWKKKKAKK
jgi:hypothetical protein